MFRPIFIIIFFKFQFLSVLTRLLNCWQFRKLQVHMVGEEEEDVALGKMGAQKATSKGKGGKQNNEEPLGEDPVNIDEQEKTESPDIKEDTNNNGKEEKKGNKKPDSKTW